jgi:hypothetical protein
MLPALAPWTGSTLKSNGSAEIKDSCKSKHNIEHDMGYLLLAETDSGLELTW